MWVIFCLLFGLKNYGKPKGKRYLWIGFGLFILFTNPLFIQVLYRYWEPPAKNVDAIKNFKVGVLLGGYYDISTLDLKSKRIESNIASGRFINTYELYKKGKIQKILLSGGDGRIINGKGNEAILVKNKLVEFGVPLNNILIDSVSKNTYENAVFSVRLLKENNFEGKEVLLISSGSHLPRTYLCFNKQGYNCSVFNAHSEVKPISILNPKSFIIPDSQGLLKIEILIKEWIGIIVYKFKGYL
jgi:uncharacterized SAM-binding protein YcdF (DUF218 family)